MRTPPPRAYIHPLARSLADKWHGPQPVPTLPCPALPACPALPCLPRSGWGYMLSRDLAEFIATTALMYAAIPER